MNKKIAVVLSGCGFKDGSEITEAISTLITLSELGCAVKIFAPNHEMPATNHLSGESAGSRNLLHESARIARGEVEDIKKLNVNQFDAVVFPGGYGAALNLCTWGKEGSKGSVLPEVQKVIEGFHSQNKPIGAICIAPALIAKVLGQHNVTLTIGNDKETAAEIKKTGAIHTDCKVDDFITDRENKVITTPAYMYDAQPFEVYTGIRKALKELVEMA